jgi:tetrapyrrole methylase family protein/MazG family protein
MDFKEKSEYKFEDLVKIVKILRAPGGCPWDREQTHKSIRSNFIEETYEAVEAIDTEDNDLLKEELGDVLLQVALHSEIESEKGTFNIDDVCDGVCKKLIIRHPHVFGRYYRTGAQKLGCYKDADQRAENSNTGNGKRF